MILRKAGKCNPTHQNKSNLDCQPDILFPTQRTKRTRDFRTFVEPNGHPQEPNGSPWDHIKRRTNKTNDFDTFTLVV